MDLVYPLRCGGCGTNGHTLCKECIDTFLYVDEESSCPMCGMPVGIRSVCGKCLDEKNLFKEGLYGFYYENKLRDAIHSFKFSGRKDVGKRLVCLIEERIVAFSARFDCIIPLPVTEKRLKERGFNQSFIIAEEISRMAGKPLYHSILHKIKGKKVLLVDDLYTTGQTAREAARILLKGKAESVVFFALARTP
jgi:competence protein ComFC